MNEHMFSVDPGKDACGVAEWRDGGLIFVELRVHPLPASDAMCVCEKPQVYRGSRVRTADLIDLAIAAGRMTGALGTFYVLPAAWKGQLPKKLQHERMMRALSPDERDVLASVKCAKHLLHNVFDAVSLGLVELGRL